VRWLKFGNAEHSTQQKNQWYDAIRRITGLDIGAAAEKQPQQEDAILQDATMQVRYKLRGKAAAKMLDMHNQEYGFARNLAGLRWIMVCIASLGAAGSGLAWALDRGSAWGSLINGSCSYLRFQCLFWLPGYVERAGIRYSESFFTALLAAAEKSPKEKANV